MAMPFEMRVSQPDNERRYEIEGGVTFVLQPNHEAIMADGQVVIKPTDPFEMRDEINKLRAENADLREELAALRSGAVMVGRAVSPVEAGDALYQTHAQCGRHAAIRAEVESLGGDVQSIVDVTDPLEAAWSFRPHEPEQLTSAGYCLTCGGEHGTHRIGCKA